ncbi:MAG: hypothetical protein MRERV_27c018 [Mycoplasmataceae bacterium RV_VA103A]|nr:MAG: hypothetical protein MRERV_27c018 [Mycoplasmataceae bacterium RV_VA103A]
MIIVFCSELPATYRSGSIFARVVIKNNILGNNSESKEAKGG